MVIGENTAVRAVAVLFFSVFLALLLVWVAPKLGLVDLPHGRKRHARPTPLVGGLVFWSVLSVLGALGAVDLGLNAWDWVALHVMGLVGLLDDIFALRARTKMLVGLLVALLLALVHGKALLALGGSYHLLGMVLPNVAYVTFPLLFLWLWFLPQAINLMDGINGLVVGFSLICLWLLGAPWLLLLPLGVILLFNYPKARLFLGDCGALLLGTLLAILAIKGRLPHNPDGIFILFIYPMVDVSLVVISRLRRRQPLGMGDRSHLHHRVTDLVSRVPWLATPLILLMALGLRIFVELGVGASSLRAFGPLLFLVFTGLILLGRSLFTKDMLGNTLGSPQGGGAS